MRKLLAVILALSIPSPSFAGSRRIFSSPRNPQRAQQLSSQFIGAFGKPAGMWIAGNVGAYDFSGNGNNGTLNGGVTVQPGGFGVFGQSWKFGTSGSIANGADISTSAVTFAALFSPQALPGSPQQLLAKQAAWNSTNGCGLWWGYVNPTDCFFQVNGTRATTPTNTLATGGWYLIVGTYDGANVKIYVNGSLLNTTALTGPIVTNALSLAAISNYFSQPFQAVWNFALTPAQVSSLYSALKNGTIPIFSPEVQYQFYQSPVAAPASTTYAIPFIENPSTFQAP